YVAAFAGSHLIADTVGTWLAVLLAAALAGLAALLAADIPESHGAAAA
ncbi:MAG: hypothetical protein QOJ63_3642, partial [Solirubrobacteraceae bacterium]|nr:hypothetical protein [Solirubrobacteraceae bacterium]